MHTFSVAISVGNIHGEKFEKLEALVDLASDYTTLPRDVLERLEVAASGRETSEFADGRQAESDTGWARLRLEGDDIYARVVFCEQGGATLLGAIGLETTRLGVDLNNRCLTPVLGRRY